MGHQDVIRVGWSLISDEALVAYAEPVSLKLEKDASLLQNGHLACPAVRAYAGNFYKVSSPFSLKLRATIDKGTIFVQPIYPFTSLAYHLVTQFVQVESVDTWSHPTRCVVQIRMPYVFYSDECVIIEQAECPIDKKRRMNWRVIPGEFDIYAWQRPVNWSFEWDFSLGDFEIGTGDPLFSLRFRSPHRPNAEFELKKFPISEKLAAQMKEAAGVSKMRRGTTALMKKAGAERAGLKLVD